jgi:hypothetical protein
VPVAGIIRRYLLVEKKEGSKVQAQILEKLEKNRSAYLQNKFTVFVPIPFKIPMQI